MAPPASRWWRPSRMAPAVELFRDVGAVVSLFAAFLVLALMGLLMRGLGVHALSKFVGCRCRPSMTIRIGPSGVASRSTRFTGVSGPGSVRLLRHRSALPARDCAQPG